MTTTPQSKKPRAISAKKDPATHFAQRVDSGKIVAGPFVRNSCRRHLCDLETGRDRGLVWDLGAASHGTNFYPEVLRLNGGQFEGKPFDLELWQAFIVGSLFGWKRADRTRRFRKAYIETGKGSGKSPLAAGIGLYGLTVDGENRAEVYAAATKMDQAKILFRDAVAMVDMSPELDQRIQRSGAKGKEWNLAYLANNSFFRPISSDDGQSGPRPHIGLLDEIHEHRDGNVVEMLDAGTKFRTQPLIVMITNSGSSKQSVCWEYHEFGRKVCSGELQDDSFFAFICGLDEGDDPFEDESCWIKANPSLGVTIQKPYLRERVTQARGMPSKEAVVKRLNFCMWVEADAPWISYELWKAGDQPVDPTLLRNRRCWGGLDLSSTQDLTSFVLLFEPTAEDPFWRLVPHFWLPEKGLAEKAEKDSVPYLSWVEHGHLRTTPGAAVSKRHVLQEIAQITASLDLQAVAYDRWRIEDLKQVMADEGIELAELKPFGQGYQSMSPAVEEFERRLVAGDLAHDNNPVMTWCAANAVTTADAANNRKLDKARSNGRIDGVVAAVMATGISTQGDEPQHTSVYEQGVL